ncbi:hypothetical protein RRG08_040533 [Elysia crispata]|uniref:Uncharacterized protein n=1 Tax=Elysia crispata TaxID=231223 RepID=A0AAE1D9Z0_9GAST|nr:hypothetical protein RRG08_040533 [Elysia crispata]
MRSQSSSKLFSSCSGISQRFVRPLSCHGRSVQGVTTGEFLSLCFRQLLYLLFTVGNFIVPLEFKGQYPVPHLQKDGRQPVHSASIVDTDNQNMRSLPKPVDRNNLRSTIGQSGSLLTLYQPMRSGYTGG